MQVVFSLISGNIGRAFEIRTTNSTYGEVFVARPLDRELIERYTLQVTGSDGCPGFILCSTSNTPPITTMESAQHAC